MEKRESVQLPVETALLLAIVLVLAGCQAIFTYTPLRGLQRPLSSLSADQRLTYAQDALASGDKAAMKAAYNAILSDTGAGAQYTAAQLGIELSGVPALLIKIASDPTSITASLSDISTFITANGLDPSYMVAAAGQLSAAAAGGADLTVMDRVMGAMGLMLGAAQSSGWNIAAIGAASAAPAAAFLAPAVLDVASLPANDPMKMFIDGFNNYIIGL